MARPLSLPRTIQADEKAMPEELRPLLGELGGLVDRYFKP